MKLDVVSASAGTGKTWRLSHDLVEALLGGSARPEGVVAITYTTKAAAELESRIRRVLLEKGRADLAARVRDGYLGTIHSVCQRLLREFALEAGLSPYLEPIPDAERKNLFDRALARVVAGKESRLNELARRLELDDWKAELRQIVDKARENGMDAAAIGQSATASRETFGRLLPPVTLTAAAYEKELRSELDRIAPALRELAAAAKKGKSAAAKARAAAAERLAADARRFGLPSWKAQVQLAASVDMPSLKHVAPGLVRLVHRHLECEAFQRDVFELQAALFELAASAMEAFAAEKAASRVVDFGDMLALAHRLLARPAVQEALRGRLDLVLVDEFQDSSPIQLAVAAGLGALSRRSVWVGDRKQAIFAFQGSDPDLMSAAMAWALQGKPPDILGKSYRSRPPLVDFTSHLFASALAPHGFPPEEVRLEAAHPDPAALATQPAFETWRWVPEELKVDGKKRSASEPCAIAAGVEALLASPPTIRERVEGGPDRLRPASRRDVAVLAFANGDCRKIASALEVRGIPARVSLQGLAGEPEALLTRAALALLADPSDGVAALEVSWLGGGALPDPDAWLSRRLSEIAAWRREHEAAEKAGERGPAQPPPFADDPRVAALR
ncbi:MAG TPA: UvrD-helicase domain-containing protein, partial [Anaeromyxobacteraceae bacterium]